MDHSGVYQRLGISISPWQLLQAAWRLAEETPTAQLVKNRVGNLSVLIDGEYRGVVDLATGEVDLWGPDEVPAPPEDGRG